MFGIRRSEIDRRLETLERQLDMVYTALVVRDPGTSMAAEAYEGLRKQIIAAASARQAHLAQLAEFDVALHHGADAEALRGLVMQWLEQAGLRRLEDPSVREAFDGAVPTGAPAEVAVPAYVSTATGQLVRQGRLRPCSAEVEDGQVGEPENATAPSVGEGATVPANETSEGSGSN